MAVAIGRELTERVLDAALWGGVVTAVYSLPEVPVPGTHVLIIGVDHYPYLIGGAQVAANAAQWGLRQLTSAVVSAREVATWFVDKHNHKYALGSVELLLSSPSPTMFTPSRGIFEGETLEIEAATMSAITSAVGEWKLRLDKHEDNIGVLYFCGHGLQAGAQFLLSETFGSNPNSTMSDAVYLDGLFEGMDRCLARKQLFLIDACRNAPTALTDLVAAAKGGAAGAQAIIEPQLNDRPSNRARDAGRIAATASEGRAFAAKPGMPSRFASALLRALRGAGWDDLDKPWKKWVLRTESLARHLDALMQLEAHLCGLPMQQPTGGGSSFVLHEPLAADMPPRIPVLARSKTPGAAAVRVLINGALHRSSPPEPTSGPWEIEVEAVPDDYEIEATFVKSTERASVSARPTLQEVDLV